MFQFKVFGHVFGKDKKEIEIVLVETRDGKEMEKVTLDSVRSLMEDMEKGAVSKQDFDLLKVELKRPAQEVEMDSVLDGGNGPFAFIRQFATSRVYTTVQGVELVKMMAERDPFIRLELAIFLFDNTLNRDSYQLILNAFEDQNDRENIIDRLKSADASVDTNGTGKDARIGSLNMLRGKLEAEETTTAA